MSCAGQATLRELAIEAGEVAVADPLEALVREHARTVFRVAYSVVRNHADAEDVVQETFLRVLRKTEVLADVENPRVWLAKVAWRIAIDRTRRRPEQPLDDMEAVLEVLRAPAADLDAHMDDQQRSELLHKLIATLPRELREVVTLSTVEEMSSAEAAEVLGIPEGSVRTRLMRARQMLKQKLMSLLEGK